MSIVLARGPHRSHDRKLFRTQGSIRRLGGAPVRGYHVLAVVSIVLVVLGAYGTTLAFPTLNVNSDEVIEAGPHYGVINVVGFAGMRISVSYAVLSSGTINVYVLDDAAYGTFSWSSYAPPSLYSNTNTTMGSFTVVIPSDGLYHIAFTHYLALYGIQQAIHVTATAGGVNWLIIAAGAGTIAVGAVVAVLALRGRKASRRAYAGSGRGGSAFVYATRRGGRP